MNPNVEPTFGDYAVIYDHYAGIPMKDGYIITDAPSLVKTSDGALLCATPMIIKGTPEKSLQPLHFFRSEDGGKTWAKLPGQSGFCCGTLFKQGETLYFLGAGPVHRKQDSAMRIIRSDDDGLTWTEPATLFQGPFYQPAGACAIRNGHLYGCCDTGRDTTYIIAGDMGRDLLDPASWRISDGLPMPQAPRELTRLDSCRGKILEGNVVEVHGRLQASWRYMIDERDTVGIGVICDFEDDGERIAYRFRQFHALPGAQNQFHIVHDAISGLYWMTANPTTHSQDQNPAFNAELDRNPRYSGPPGKERRILALYCSFDALNWLPAGYVIVWPLVRQASNYCGLLIDGDDLLVASRTSRNGQNQHDNDLTAFHRVKNFRERASILKPGEDL